MSPQQGYTVRIGARTEPTPVAAEGPYTLPYSIADDDGAVVVGLLSQLICTDCGRGALKHAEAGYVPWHRICDVCGSHWYENPVIYTKLGEQGWYGRTGRRGELWPISSLDPDLRLPPGLTHVELFNHASAQPYDEPGLFAAWARRARFY